MSSSAPRPHSRMLVLSALVVVMIGTLISHEGIAGKRTRPRKVSDTYQSPAPAAMVVHPYGTAVCNQEGAAGGNRGCVTFQAIPGERFVKVEVTDATGLPVPGFVAFDDDPSTWTPFCGSTDKPIKTGLEVTVWLFSYQAPNIGTCPGTSTTGTVEATFLRRR